MVLMMMYRANFIKYGYKEAIEEGLKEEYGDGVRFVGSDGEQVPNQFSGEYPSTDEERSIALKALAHQTRSRRAWAVNNAQNPQTRLRMSQLAEYLYDLDINFPFVLCVIVADYAVVAS